MFRGYYSSHKAAGAIAQGLNAISAPATIEQPLKKKLFAMSHVTLCCYFCLVSQTPAWIMLNPRHHFSPRLN